MMGSFRFILSLAVVLAHTGGVFGYTITGGQTAVHAFYIVSGFLMSLILNEKYTTSSSYSTFISNRFLRIYAPYFIVLAMSILYEFVDWSGATRFFFENSSKLSPLTILFLIISNISIFGLDIGMFLGIHDGSLAFEAFSIPPEPRVWKFYLIPQAWTLSLELMFYLVAPFIVRRGLGVILPIIGAGIVARWMVGIDVDPWCYRFFPFEISTFLLGAVSYRVYKIIEHRKSLPWEGLASLTLLIATLAYPLYGSDGFMQSGIIVYLLIITVTLPFLHKLTNGSKIDRLIGELSYPIYLVHYLILRIVLSLTPFHDGEVIYPVMVFLGSLAISIAIVRFVEIPVDRYRQRRYRQMLAKGPCANSEIIRPTVPI